MKREHKLKTYVPLFIRLFDCYCELELAIEKVLLLIIHAQAVRFKIQRKVN